MSRIAYSRIAYSPVATGSFRINNVIHFKDSILSSRQQDRSEYNTLPAWATLNTYKEQLNWERRGLDIEGAFTAPYTMQRSMGNLPTPTERSNCHATTT